MVLAEGDPQATHIFISYAGEDGDVARQLVVGLESHGFRAWYYQRDSRPGVSYLQQVLTALEECSACILLLSADALQSFQVDREITIIYERNMRVIPILIGLIHDQFRARRPEWAMMLGATVTTSLPEEGIAAILPQIVNSLRWESASVTSVHAEAPVPRPAPRVRLPTPPTPFVGRAVEHAAVGTLLGREDVRLVTLTGPGGSGKTRLALDLAARHFDRYPDGVFFVPLAAVQLPGLVASSIAAALDLQEEASTPIVETLKSSLQSRQLLLVLDNLEHLPDAFPLIGELLEACPWLNVLVTSRMLLRLQGEHEYSVGPMQLPPLDRLPAIEELACNDAVDLFLQRAQAAKPGLQLTAENARTIATICVRLDGLPLALELAAARIKLFSPDALLKRLQRRLALLTHGTLDAGERQQTLWNTIDWSYRLLSAEEQALLCRLSVFVGGFTIEPAESVAGEGSVDVFDCLVSLTDKSLLGQLSQDDGEPRFTMLETIREFASEHLRDRADADTVQRRHAEFFTTLAEEAKRGLQGSESTIWLERVDRELGNFIAAIEWARATGDEMALRIAGALFSFWYRSHLSQGREQLEAALAAGIAASPQSRLSALLAAGNLAHVQSDYQRAIALLEEALAVSRDLDGPKNIASALNNLGVVAVDAGDLERGAMFYQESLALRRQIDDRAGIATSLNNLATVSQYRELYDEARSRYEESLAVWRELGNEWAVGVSLANLAEIAVRQNDPERATALYRESLALARKLDDQVGAALCLEGLAAIHATHNAEEATSLLAGADALRALAGAERSPREREEYDRVAGELQASLGAERYTDAWIRGGSMSLDELVGTEESRMSHA